MRFHFFPNCGSTIYWEGDGNPAVGGGAVVACDTSAFAPPSDSIWAEWMYAWLRVPEGIDHHKQGRPSATWAGSTVRRRDAHSLRGSFPADQPPLSLTWTVSFSTPK